MNFFEFLQRQLLEAFYKKILFLKIEQNSQENGYAKKRLSHRCFTVNFSRILGIAFLQNRACNFIKKETSAKAFYLEVCKIFKDSLLKNTSGSFFFILDQVIDSWILPSMLNLAVILSLPKVHTSFTSMIFKLIICT